MKNEVLVSVIMSEYNTDEKKLRISIESILNQTYKNIEFLIVDDCGKNNVEKIIKGYKDKRIKILKNKKNMGLVYSLNYALKEAKGKYVVRMDTDDYAYPDRIEKQLNFIVNNPKYVVVGMNCKFYDGQKINGMSNLTGEVDRNRLLNGATFIHPTVIMDREIILKVGGYSDYNRCEDYALWIKLYLNNYSGYIMKDIGLRYTISLDDYKKRSLKTRKGLLKLLKEEYIKLNPSKIQLIKIYTKTILAGIIPHKIMYLYQKKKMVK